MNQVKQFNISKKNDSTARQYYLDWIRVITIVCVFFFHCGRFFDSEDWSVKNGTTSATADLLIFFMVQWMMPIFFFISGASTFFALKSKTGGKFLNDRVKRILVPLVFGILILSPHQVYLERLSHHQFTGTFIDFLPQYFSGFYGFGGNFAWMGLHLWYLLLLFIFSVIALPLFLWWKRTSNSVEKANYNILYLLIFVFVLALPGFVLPLDSLLGGRPWGGWNIVEHLILFILGYYTFSKTGFQKLLPQNRYLLLTITFLLTALNIYLFVNHIKFEFQTAGYLFKILLRSAVCFGWIFTIMGFAEKNLNYSNGLLKYGNEAVLPFYIIHQPVIILIGYFIVQWHLPIILKYALIATISLCIVMICYQFLIKKYRILRYLFGMGITSKKTEKVALTTKKSIDLKLRNMSL